jgi:bifunctional non-homologous end joining protein LigD
MPLRRAAEPFDDPDWLFELKYDGFRALAYIDQGRCRLVSRNGNEFKSFGALAEEMGNSFESSAGVLDGEIVCLDRQGKPRFYDFLYRPGTPVFVAFDVIWRGSEDLRFLPLIDRKQELRRVLRRAPPCVLYADHVDGCGVELILARLRTRPRGDRREAPARTLHPRSGNEHVVQGAQPRVLTVGRTSRSI